MRPVQLSHHCVSLDAGPSAQIYIYINIKIKSIHITLLCARFRAILLYVFAHACIYIYTCTTRCVCIYKLAEARWPPPHASWAPPCAIRAELQTGSAVEAQPSCVPRQRWATPPAAQPQEEQPWEAQLGAICIHILTYIYTYTHRSIQ